MEVVFLGINDTGMKIYEWLCQRDTVEILAMITEAEQLELIRREDPDLIVSVGFSHKVPEDVLAVPSQGAVNVHPSLLPHNRGMNPNVWSLVEGTPAGVTIHYMDAAFDTGDIIAQREVETDFSDTGKQLYRCLEAVQFELFTEVWPEIESGSVERTPQEDAAGSYHSKDDFVDLCELDPDQEVRVKELLDRLRALTFPPFDNAFLEIDGERYYVDIEIRNAPDERDNETEGMLSSY